MKPALIGTMLLVGIVQAVDADTLTPYQQMGRDFVKCYTLK